MADGAELSLGKRSVKWLDAPHLPHGWETGFLMDTRTRTLFCGDLFTQGGRGAAALTSDDILENSEAFRQPMDYFSHTTNTSQADRTPGSRIARHPGVHAWQRLERRWREAAACPR